jgi:hypothetical protein
MSVPYLREAAAQDDLGKLVSINCWNKSPASCHCFALNKSQAFFASTSEVSRFTCVGLRAMERRIGDNNQHCNIWPLARKGFTVASRSKLWCSDFTWISLAERL